MKFAAIDIGSNAIRLLITEVTESKSGLKYKKHLFTRVPLRLGDDSFLHKKISEEKITKLIKAMSAFKTLMGFFDVKEYMACGTSALRDAENGKEVTEKAQEQAGIKIEIIDGKTESEIIYSNHIAESLNHNKSYLYIDLGGGSIELSVFSKGKILASDSFPVGAIRYLCNAVSVNTWETFKEWVKTNTANVKPLIAIGSGGNINKLAKMIGNNKKDNKIISYKDLKQMHDELNACSLEERIKKYDLNEDRADVIVPAAKIFTSVMKWAEIDEIYIPKLGLVDGIINHLYDKYCGVK